MTRQLWTESHSRAVEEAASPNNPTKFWEVPSMDRTVLAIPDHLLPDWMSTAARMLLGSPEGNDWTALGHQLGILLQGYDTHCHVIRETEKNLKTKKSHMHQSVLSCTTLLSCFLL